MILLVICHRESSIAENPSNPFQHFKMQITRSQGLRLANANLTETKPLQRFSCVSYKASHLKLFHMTPPPPQDHEILLQFISLTDISSPQSLLRLPKGASQ